MYNVQKLFPAPVWPLITIDYVKVFCVIILQYLSILSLHICSAIFYSEYDCSLWTQLFDIEPTGYQPIVFSIEARINSSFIGMLYNVIKYYPFLINIASMNIEGIFHLFSTAFSFVGLNKIEYCTAGIYDDGISSFTITLLNILSA